MATTTPKRQLPYPVASDTADVPRDIQALATRLDNNLPAPGTLPASPVTGDECYYQAATTPNVVYWHLRYNGTNWDSVGGAPLLTYDGPQQAFGAAAGWQPWGAT